MRLQDKLEAIRQALEAKDDLTYAPLLDVVREAKSRLCGDLGCYAAGRYRDGDRRDHLHPGFITRNWDKLPPGALATALATAACMCGIRLVFGEKYSAHDEAACNAVLEALTVPDVAM